MKKKKATEHHYEYYCLYLYYCMSSVLERLPEWCYTGWDLTYRNLETVQGACRQFTHSRSFKYLL